MDIGLNAYRFEFIPPEEFSKPTGARSTAKKAAFVIRLPNHVESAEAQAVMTVAQSEWQATEKYKRRRDLAVKTKPLADRIKAIRDSKKRLTKADKAKILSLTQEIDDIGRLAFEGVSPDDTRIEVESARKGFELILPLVEEYLDPDGAVVAKGQELRGFLGISRPHQDVLGVAADVVFRRGVVPNARCEV